MKIVKKFPRKVREIENSWIPMPDGCQLAARVWLPEDAETSPVPAILEYIPYRKRDGTVARDEPIHRYFAGHGYATARVDVRGSGDSQGIIHDEYLHQEHDDAVAVIAWLAAQPWCTGAVGMMGKSWGGFNSLQVAALSPPELKAIITVCSTDDRYADDMHYMGGCLLNDNLAWGSTFLAFMARPPDPAIVGEGWRRIWFDRLDSATFVVEPWLRHQRRDSFWKHGSVCEDFGRIACPVYAVGGWHDGYSNAIPRLLAGLDVPRKGLIGPWGHQYPHSGLPGPAIGFLKEALRWWDHWLKGEETGVMDEPMLRAWMMERVPPKPMFAEVAGRWIAEPTWPGPGIEARRYAITAEGLTTEAAAERRLLHRSPQTAGLAGGEWCAYGLGELGAEMALDQREDDGKSITFDSAPLDESVEILGAPLVTLDLAVDRPDAFVVVRLNDVAPDGAAARVTYGALNLTHRNGDETPEPMEPGRRTTVRVRLNDVAYAFPEGHQMRLAVSTSYWPMFWPSPEPVTLSLFTGAGALELPVRPPRPEDARLPRFAKPESAPPPARTVLRPARDARTLRRDLATGEVVFANLEDSGAVRLDAIELEVEESKVEEFRIRDDDPLSARAEIYWTSRRRRGDWHVRVETRTAMTATKEAFRLKADLDAFEGETRVFARSWDREVARDMV